MDLIETIWLIGCGFIGGAAFCITLWIAEAISKFFERRK